MSEVENLQSALRPEMNWFYAVPSMQVTGDSVSFSYPDSKITSAVIQTFGRTWVEDVNLVLRQFSSLHAFYGMHSTICAWADEFIQEAMPADQAIARARYANAILVAGMSDLAAT